MEQDSDLAIIGFRKMATHLFEELYHNFKEQAGTLDRQTDEDVFQLLRGRYERQLQHQLDQVAKDWMHAYKRGNILQLQKSLTEHIAYFLLEFKRKTDGL